MSYSIFHYTERNEELSLNYLQLINFNQTQVNTRLNLFVLKLSVNLDCQPKSTKNTYGKRLSQCYAMHCVAIEKSKRNTKYKI